MGYVIIAVAFISLAIALFEISACIPYALRMVPDNFPDFKRRLWISGICEIVAGVSLLIGYIKF